MNQLNIQLLPLPAPPLHLPMLMMTFLSSPWPHRIPGTHYLPKQRCCNGRASGWRVHGIGKGFHRCWRASRTAFPSPLTATVAALPGGAFSRDEVMPAVPRYPLAIFVKTLSGRTITLGAMSDDTIGTVMAKVCFPDCYVMPRIFDLVDCTERRIGE